MISLVLVLGVTGTVLAQGKGVDKQSERVRDGSTRTPGVNGSKTDTGAGRGFDFGKDKSKPVSMLPNPYSLSGRSDVIIKVVQDVMRDQYLILYESASRFTYGILVCYLNRIMK